MKKVFFAFFLTLFVSLAGVVSVHSVSAQTDKCTDQQHLQCPNGCDPATGQCRTAQQYEESKQTEIFGTIEAPEGVARYNAAPGAEGGIGLIVFVSTLIRLATIVAGVWVMFNFILAGWTYITSSGEVKTHAEVAQKLTFSVVGLVLIVGAYTAAALIGLVLFGDASYIINPTFQGVPGT